MTYDEYLNLINPEKQSTEMSDEETITPNATTPTTQQESAPEKTHGIVDTVVDFGKGAVAGIFKEVENIVQTGHDIADFVDNKLGDGTAIDDNKDYDFVPNFLKPETGLGKTAQALSAFATGWVTMGKAVTLAGSALKGVSVAQKLAKAAPNSKWLGRVLKEGTVDFVTGDGSDERFADVLVDNEVLGSAVFRYLASDADDSALEGRLKNVIEGFILGKATDGILGAIKGIKKNMSATAKGSLDGALAARKEGAEAVEKLVADTAEVAPKIDVVGKTAEEIKTAMKEADIWIKTDAELTPKAKANAFRELYSTNPQKAIDGLKDAQKAGYDIEHAATSVKEMITEYGGPELEKAFEDKHVKLAEIFPKSLQYLQDNGFDKVLDKDKLLALRKEDGNLASAVEAGYLLFHAPEQTQILLRQVEEELPNAVQNMRNYTSDLFDVLVDLKAANMAAGQQLNMSKIGRYVLGRGKEQLVDKIAKKAVAGKFTEEQLRSIKEVLANKSDREIIDMLTSFNRVAKNNDIKGLIKLTDTAVEMAEKGDLWDAAYKWRYIAMLSSVKTNLRNVIGNTMKLPIIALEESARGAALGFINNEGITGRVAGTVSGAKNGLYYLQGLKYAHAQAFETLQNALKYNTPLTRNSELNALAKDKLGDWGIFETPLRALMACDEYFASLAGTAKAYERAVLDLNATGALKGADTAVRNDLMRKWLDDYMPTICEKITMDDGRVVNGAFRFIEDVATANDATFQQALEGFSKSFSNFVNSNRHMKLVFPFVKTPTNIFKDTLWTRGMNLPNEFKKAFAEGASPQQKAQAIAHLTSAAAIWGSAYGLYQSGLITGPGPSNPQQLEAKKATGWQPNAVKIGQSYLSLNAFEPFGTAMGLIATFCEKMARAEYDEDTQMLDALGTKAFESLMYITADKTYVKGLNSALVSLNRAISGNGEQAFSGYGLPAQTVASFVPSVLRDLGYAIDPIKRDAPDLLDAAQDRIPWLRSELAPRVDWLTGKDIETDSGPVGAFLNPFNTTEENGSLIALELSKLTGVGKPERKLDNIPLTPNQYAEYCRSIGTVKIGGRTLAESLAALITSEEYQRSQELYPDPTPYALEKKRNDIIGNLIKAYKDEGKVAFLRENPTLVARMQKTNVIQPLIGF